MEKDQKTERATPKKRRDERKRGNVFTSRDVVNFVSILAVFYMLKLYFPMLTKELSATVQEFIAFAGSVKSIDVGYAMFLYKEALVALLITILPVAGTALLAGVLGTGVQTGFLFSGESLKPKFSRMNPLQGFKRMFSSRSFVELLKGVVKIVVILVVLYNFFLARLSDFADMLHLEVEQSVDLILNAVMDLIYQVCIVFIFIAAVDYMFQRWDYEKNIRMTKQEVKEEYKQTEGDPQVKNQIKQRQRRIAMSRMIQQVPTADVVIRNPTHYAVALRYDLDRDNAPVVVAKGADEVARRIIRVAEEHEIHVTEDVELTRAIYAAAEVGDEIPFDFYHAVAELLAMVFQLSRRAI